MYSSVPTKEFDALIGSAINIGACGPFFLSFVVEIKSYKE